MEIVSYHLDRELVKKNLIEQQVGNALYTIKMAGISNEVSVYKGIESPIAHFKKKSHQTVEDLHGESFFPKARQRSEKKHAIDFLVEKIHQYSGEINLLCIALLINIAMAMKKDPTIIPKIAHIYFMGGSNNALGNITPAAEYNFWVDPEAARVVLHSGVTSLGTSHPDTLLVVVASDENVMVKSNFYHVDVETKGELTRGYSLVDINNRLGRTKNVRVCEEINQAKFKEMLFNMLINLK